MDVTENRYSIALVDDNKEFLDNLNCFLKQLFLEHHKPVAITIYDSPHAFLWDVQDGKQFDLYILDIKMPKMDGIDLAKKVREMDEWHHILFLTDFEGSALKSYQVNACNYVLKANYKAEISASILKCYQIWEKQKSDCYRFFYDSKFRILPCHTIQYIKYDTNTRMLTIVTDKESLKERKSLTKFLEEIKKDYFMVVARGIAINLLQVIGAEEGHILLTGGAKVPLGPKYKREFYDKMMLVIGDNTFGRI